jgi:hypothetical protein
VPVRFRPSAPHYPWGEFAHDGQNPLVRFEPFELIQLIYNRDKDSPLQLCLYIFMKVVGRGLFRPVGEGHGKMGLDEQPLAIAVGQDGCKAKVHLHGFFIRREVNVGISGYPAHRILL